MGGGLLWVITNLSKYGKATEPITEKESNAINKRIPTSFDKTVEIITGTLQDNDGNKINDYGYTIYSKGNTGTRNSLRGKYEMTLTYKQEPPAQPPRSASGAYGSSASAPSSRSASVAYVPTAQPSRSAYGASAYAPPPYLYDIPNLPEYFTIYDKIDKDGGKYKTVCVKNYKLMQHLTKIGDSITIDGIVYTKNTDSTIEMKTKNNYIYQLNNTSEGDTFCIYNK